MTGQFQSTKNSVSTGTSDWEHEIFFRPDSSPGLVTPLLKLIDTINVQIEATGNNTVDEELLRPIIAAVGINSPILRTRIFKVCVEVPTSARPLLYAQLESLVDADACGSALILAALERACGNEHSRAECFDRILQFGDSSPDRQKTLIVALRLLGTSAAHQNLIEVLGECAEDPHKAREILSELGLTAKSEFLPAIVDQIEKCGWWNEPKIIPQTLCRLVRVPLLSVSLSELKYQRLAHALGYIDDAVVDDISRSAASLSAAQEILSSVGVASAPLLEEYLQTAEVDRATLLKQWQAQVSDSTRSFERVTEVPTPVRFEDGLLRYSDVDLLYAALRPSDVLEMLYAPHELPFTLTVQLTDQFEAAYYKGLDFFREVFSVSAARLSKIYLVDLAPDLQQALAPYLIADFAGRLSENNSELVVARHGIFHARWGLIARLLTYEDGAVALAPEFKDVEPELNTKVHGPLSEMQRILEPFFDDGSKQLLKYQVLEPERVVQQRSFAQYYAPKDTTRDRSFGAAAVMSLLYYQSPTSLFSKVDVEREAIDSAEEFGSHLLASIGIELQSPNVAPECAQSWKQAAEHFGIRSPERFAFKSVVETSLPPCFSAFTAVKAIEYLHAMGLNENYRGSVALHISIAGDLGAQIGALALPLRFLRISQSARETRPLHERLAFLMSKGFAFRSNETQAASEHSTAPEFRTELRMSLIQTIPGTQTLNNIYETFLPAVQYLATACLANSRGYHGPTALVPKLSSLWREYNDRFEASLFAFDAEDLLHIDWYESTGDARASELVLQLKSIEILKQVDRRFANDRAAYKAMQKEVCKLFFFYAEKIEKVLRTFSLENPF